MLPVRAALAYQPQVCLIDEISRLEAVIRPFATQLSPSEVPKFAVNQRQQPVQRSSIAGAPRHQQFGDVNLGGVRKTLRHG